MKGQWFMYIMLFLIVSIMQFGDYLSKKGISLGKKVELWVNKVEYFVYWLCLSVMYIVCIPYCLLMALYFYVIRSTKFENFQKEMTSFGEFIGGLIDSDNPLQYFTERVAKRCFPEVIYCK
jgi:hypothetical protein